MTKTVRYQQGELYRDHGAWFVRYRERVRQADHSMKTERRAERLGSVEEFPTRAEIEPLRTAFMQGVNATAATPDASMTLTDFVERVYLPYVERELRPSTHKGYRGVWRRYLAEHIGSARLRRFRTVDASRLLRTLAEERGVNKTTLGHVKGVLSAIFTHAKNEGAYDGTNPIQDARIPRQARGAGETFAYQLAQILRILDVLPLLPRAVVATASFAGLREGELRGFEWPDYGGGELRVRRSVWKTFVNEPKTHASREAVPVIPVLARTLEAYRTSMHSPKAGVVFHDGSGRRMDLDKLAQRVIRPAVEAIGLPWYGWHGFRRGIASNLFALGVDDKVVQRILRHAKPHVTRERYIKTFDPAIAAAMQKMQAAVDALGPRLASSWPAIGSGQN
jgi:integrase